MLGFCSSFQFTHPVWGATASLSQPLLVEVFQFTHPVWGATIGFGYISAIDIQFQFTHPVWGATAMPKGTHK